MLNKSSIFFKRDGLSNLPYEFLVYPHASGCRGHNRLIIVYTLPMESLLITIHKLWVLSLFHVDL
jgi:hypothetical protein